MKGRRNLELYIFSSKCAPGSTQRIQVTFDLMQFETNLDRKAMVNDIDKYIREYLQWEKFDIRLFTNDNKEILITQDENYMVQFLVLDFMNFMLIEYQRTGNFEIEKDALSPEEAGLRQVLPQGVQLPHIKIKNRDNSEKNEREGNLNNTRQIKNKSKEAKSYKWQSNPDKELPELYNKMKGVYVDADTTLEQFTAIFTGQPTKSITLVKWIGQKNLLPYFIEVSFKLKKLSGITNKWATCKLCFNGVDNLSQSRDLYLNNKKGLPRNSHQIDELFKTL